MPSAQEDPFPNINSMVGEDEQQQEDPFPTINSLLSEGGPSPTMGDLTRDVISPDLPSPADLGIEDDDRYTTAPDEDRGFFEKWVADPVQSFLTEERELTPVTGAARSLLRTPGESIVRPIGQWLQSIPEFAEASYRQIPMFRHSESGAGQREAARRLSAVLEPATEPAGEAITRAGRTIGAEAFPKSPSQQRGEIDLTDPQWYAENAPEAIGQVATQYGIATMTGGTGLTSSLLRFGGAGALLEGGAAYEQTKRTLQERGMDEDEAERRAALNALTTGVGAGALETVPGLAYLTDAVPGAERVLASSLGRRVADMAAGRAIPRALATSSAEFAQEASQEAYADVVQYASETDPEAFQNWQERYLGVGILGGIAGGAVGGFTARGPEPGGPPDVEGVRPLQGPDAIRQARMRGPEAEAQAIEREQQRLRGPEGRREQAAESVRQQLGQEPQYEGQYSGRGEAAVPFPAAAGEAPPVIPDAESARRLYNRIGRRIFPGLAEQAETDALTGLQNVQGEQRALEQADPPEAERVQLMGDLDNFKAVNDNLGHEAGNDALRVVSRALREATRESDVVSLARPGGDEFRVTMDLPEGTSPNAVRYRIENQVNEALAEEGFDEVAGTQVGFSLGTSDQDLYARKEERGVSEERQRREQRRAEQEEQFGERSRGEEGPARTFVASPSDLKMAPEALQYKEEGIGESGTTDQLENVEQWKSEYAKVVAVWRWDDPAADGYPDHEPGYYVVDGHHRVELARQLMEDQPAARQMNVMEIEADSPAEARRKGAMMNMATGNGTRIDAAKFLRSADMTVGDLRESGVPINERVVEEGLALSKLAEPLWRSTLEHSRTDGRKGLSPMRAVAIGKSNLSEDEQVDVWQVAQDRDMNVSEMERLIEIAEGTGGREADAEQAGLFGEETETNLAEQAEVADYVLNEIKQDRTMANALTVRGRAERAEELGVAEIETEEAQKIGQRAEMLEQGFQSLWTRSGPINEIISEAADRLRAGDNETEVKQDALEQVQQRLPDLLGRGAAEGAREEGTLTGGQAEQGGAAEPEGTERAELEGPPEPAGADRAAEVAGQENLLSPAMGQGDLFGGTGPAEGGDQFQMEMEGPEGQQTAEEARQQARETVERLRQTVEEGDPTLEQLESYRDALRMLTEGEGRTPELQRIERRIENMREGPRLQGPEGQQQLLSPETATEPESSGPRVDIGDRLKGRMTTPPQPGDPVSRPDIIAQLANVAVAANSEVPIRTGRTPPEAVGVFKVQPEVIRIRNANDVATAFHEVAHATEKAVFGFPDRGPWKMPRASQRMQNELIQLGQRLYKRESDERQFTIRGDVEATEDAPTGGWKREGFAEYLRLWGTDPEQAQELAPNFTRWFDGQFAETFPEVYGELETARELVERYGEQGAQQRASAARIDPASRTRQIKQGTKTLGRNLYEYTVEQLQPYRELRELYQEQTGEQLAPSEDPWITGQALRMAHSSRVRYMVERGMIDFAGNRTGQALSDIRPLVRNAPIPEGLQDWSREELFKNYLHARRAQALWRDVKSLPEEVQQRIEDGEISEEQIPDEVWTEYGRDPGMTLQDADWIVGELDSDHFRQAAKIVHDWQDGILDYMAESSPTMEQIVERVKERDPGSYIPLQREQDEPGDLRSRALAEQDALASETQPIRRLRGSGRRIMDPLTTAIAQAEERVRAAHERFITDQIIELSQAEGMGQLVEELEPDRVPVAERSLQEIIDEVENRIEEEGGQLTVEAEDIDMAGEMVTFFAPKKYPGREEPIVARWDAEAGRVRWFQMDPSLYEALDGMKVPQLPKAVDWLLGVPGRTFRAGTTSLRASFGMLWNPTKDIQTFAVNTRSNANGLKLAGDLIGAWKDAALRRVAGREADDYMDAFIRLGGEMAQPLGADIPHTRRVAHKVMEPSLTEVKSMGEALRFWRIRELDPRNWYDWFRDTVQFPESAPRVAELKRVAEEEVGWQPGEPMNLDQSLQLLLASKQVTTDFTAGGKWGRYMNRMVPFHNAAIQGPRATVRAARRDWQKVAWRLSILSALSVLQWWGYRDEEWWKELDYRSRYMYWWFPTTMPDGEKTLTRIPKAFEIGALTAFPVAALDQAYQQDSEAVAGWMHTTFDITHPPVVPQTFGVAAEQLANERFFWESPIVPRGEQRMPAEEQFGLYTTEASKVLGDLFNVSPRRLDHVREGVLGRASTDLLNMLGIGASGAGPMSALGITGRRGFESEAADMPIIGRMFQRGGRVGTNPKSVDELYQTLQEAQKIQASEKTEESPRQRQLRLMLNDATNAISALSYVRTHTPDREKRNELNRTMAEMARSALQAYEQGEINRPRFRAFRNRAEAQETRVQRRRQGQLQGPEGGG